MSKWTFALIAIVALTNSLLAGVYVDWMSVATPACEEVRLNGSADFSRVADLGHGQTLSPVIALRRKGIDRGSGIGDKLVE